MDPAHDQPTFAFLANDEDAAKIEQIMSGRQCERIAYERLSDIVRRPLAVLILTDEALLGLDTKSLQAEIERQPTWSDLPVIAIIDRKKLRQLDTLFDKIKQVRIVERPIDPLILGRAVRSAERSRERQRGARSALLRLEDAENRYCRLNEMLEQRVRERIEQLESAYERLVREAEDRWAAEEKLRESEELYRYTVELGRQLVWTADPEGTIRTINPLLSRITGLPDDLPPHEGWLRSVHPDDLPDLLAIWQRAVAEGSPVSADFRVRLENGSYRTFRARAAPRSDELGRVMRWYGTTEDVEDEVRAEAERRAAEERYRLAAYATNDAIWDLDVASGRIDWAASSAAFFGYRPSDAHGSLDWWMSKVHPEDRERVISNLETALERGEEHWSATYRFLRSDGDYADVEDQCYIMRGEDGRPRRAVGAMTDVTGRREAEAELRRLQSELIHVSRLSAMGAMGSTLAHELNQPLTAVSSYISGSRRLLGEDPEANLATVQEALEDAEAAALRAGQIVRRVRELVAKGQVSVRAENLPALLAEACAIGLVDARLIGISYELTAAKDAEWVYADRIQIQQVMINLLRNAVQALQDQPERRIQIRTEARSGLWIQISISDTGPGLAKGGEDAVFEAFRTTKPGGMGIGLSISRTIVEAHGGKIWAEQVAGGGARFCFTLPAADSTALEDDGVAVSLPDAAPKPL